MQGVGNELHAQHNHTRAGRSARRLERRLCEASLCAPVCPPRPTPQGLPWPETDCFSLAENILIFTACMLSRFSHIRLSETLWTVARRAPQSMGFSRQEYWSGLPLPPPGNPPNPGVESTSLNVSCIGKEVLYH